MTTPQDLSAAAFNQLFNDADGIYHDYAKRYKLSETALFLLCTLYESEKPLTQKALATEWHYPPQTINSILKRLKDDGTVRLENVPDDRRSKRIVLTEHGRALCAEIVEPLIACEEHAFAQLSENERRTLLTLTRKYLALLRQEFSTESAQ